MIRLVAYAIGAGALAALILVQMQGTMELTFWELLLIALVLFQYRGIPHRGDPLEVPLFTIPPYEPERLPRSLANTELAVVDAVSGYLSPERRLRPALRRLADHRLSMHGKSLGRDATETLLGPEGLALLESQDDAAIDEDDLAELVARLERL